MPPLILTYIPTQRPFSGKSEAAVRSSTQSGGGQSIGFLTSVLSLTAFFLPCTTMHTPATGQKLSQLSAFEQKTIRYVRSVRATASSARAHKVGLLLHFLDVECTTIASKKTCQTNKCSRARKPTQSIMSLLRTASTCLQMSSGLEHRKSMDVGTIATAGPAFFPYRYHFEATSTTPRADTTIPTVTPLSTEARHSPPLSQGEGKVLLGIPLHALGMPLFV